VSGPTPFTNIGGVGTVVLQAACDAAGRPQLRAQTSVNDGVIKASSIDSAGNPAFTELDDLDTGASFDISGGLALTDSAIVQVSYVDVRGLVAEAQLGFEAAPPGFDCAVTGVIHGAA
jgi:hypothetical protein